MLKGSDASPSESTCPVMTSWNWRIRLTNLVGHPSLDRITQMASLLTASRAFVRSMKTATGSIFCSMHFSCTWRTEKIMSVVLQFGRNPHWTSGRFSSEMLVMRGLRMTRARIFPATDRREMPGQLPQSVSLLLFLNRETNVAFLKSLGTSSSFQMRFPLAVSLV